MEKQSYFQQYKLPPADQTAKTTKKSSIVIPTSSEANRAKEAKATKERAPSPPISPRKKEELALTVGTSSIDPENVIYMENIR